VNRSPPATTPTRRWPAPQTVSASCPGFPASTWSASSTRSAIRLGWNSQAETWEAWDDPRASYPGPPDAVLDPAGFTDPEITTATETIEMEDRVDARRWLDYGPEFLGLLPDTDDTVPLPALDF
jgi:hypothetical protein